MFARASRRARRRRAHSADRARAKNPTAPNITYGKTNSACAHATAANEPSIRNAAKNVSAPNKEGELRQQKRNIDRARARRAARPVVAFEPAKRQRQRQRAGDGGERDRVAERAHEFGAVVAPDFERPGSPAERRGTASATRTTTAPAPQSRRRPAPAPPAPRRPKSRRRFASRRPARPWRREGGRGARRRLRRGAKGRSRR